MAKTRKKRRTRRKTRPSGSGMNLRLLLAVGLLMLLAGAGYVAFDDRHWHAFDDAGDGAYKRQNFEYAENMYRKALMEAQRLDERELIDASLSDLQRTAHAQGRTEEAASFGARRAALRR